jgi:hypothetical protein
MNTRLLLAPVAGLLLLATAVNAASLTINSAAPSAGSYTMKVDVSGFSLKPLGTTPNAANQGHIHYLVKLAGTTEFKDACSAGRATCAAATDYATPNTSFTFKDLKAGDIVAARLVNNDHSNLSPDVLQQQTVKASAKSSPGAGILLVAAALAVAAFARRKA